MYWALPNLVVLPAVLGASGEGQAANLRTFLERNRRAADRPTTARVRLQVRSLWMISGQCGLTLEVTDLRVEPPCRECPL